MERNLLQYTTTYNRSALIKSYTDTKHVVVILKNRKFRLEIKVERSDATELASPIMGFMDGRISESMTSIIYTKVLNISSNEVVFKDIGRNAGLEVAGNIGEIFI